MGSMKPASSFIIKCKHKEDVPEVLKLLMTAGGRMLFKCITDAPTYLINDDTGRPITKDDSSGIITHISTRFGYVDLYGETGWSIEHVSKTLIKCTDSPKVFDMLNYVASHIERYYKIEIIDCE